MIWALAHHEEQKTNIDNLQTTKHKKNRKEVKKKNATSSNVHDCEPSPSWHFLLVTSTAINHPLNLGSIEVLLRGNGYFGMVALEVEIFCYKMKILLRKNKSLVKNRKVLSKGKSLVIMKYRFC